MNNNSWPVDKNILKAYANGEYLHDIVLFIQAVLDQPLYIGFDYWSDCVCDSCEAEKNTYNQCEFCGYEGRFYSDHDIDYESMNRTAFVYCPVCGSYRDEEGDWWCDGFDNPELIKQLRVILKEVIN